ncbi:alpha/beta fold hydrolase [Arenicella sp. 4NH20-0111]
MSVIANWVHIEAKDGYSVPCFVRSTQGNTRNILVMPALGVRASFYKVLAEELCENGFNAILLEQRGYGKSSVRPSRTSTWGFFEPIDSDIPAVLDWVDTELGGSTAILGHSLGGHLALCYCALNLSRVDRVVLPACGSPWIDAYIGLPRIQIITLLCLIPAMNFMFGYYRGSLTGFGGNESSQVMNDWRHLAKRNQYRVQGVTSNIDLLLEEFKGKVLSVSFQDDGLAPKAAVEAILNKMPIADVTRVSYSSEELSLGERESLVKADHFGWAKSPNSTVSSILDWW